MSSGQIERVRLQLIVGLCLATLAFWNGADFFHEDEGPEYVADCPICSLQRAASCETPSVSLAEICALQVVAATPITPQHVQRAADDHSTAAKPRGPPAGT